MSSVSRDRKRRRLIIMQKRKKEKKEKRRRLRLHLFEAPPGLAVGVKVKSFVAPVDAEPIDVGHTRVPAALVGIDAEGAKVGVPDGLVEPTDPEGVAPRHGYHGVRDCCGSQRSGGECQVPQTHCVWQPARPTGSCIKTDGCLYQSS